MQSIWEHRDVCLTVATRNWILPNSCIPLPNLIFRYCDRQMAEVITEQMHTSLILPHLLYSSRWMTHRCISTVSQRNPDPISTVCSVRNIVTLVTSVLTDYLLNTNNFLFSLFKHSDQERYIVANIQSLNIYVWLCNSLIITTTTT